MKAVKYTLNNDKVRYLMSTDNQLNMLMKYIENTELVIELDGFSCLIKYIIGQQISDKARETIWTRFKTTNKNLIKNQTQLFRELIRETYLQVEVNQLINSFYFVFLQVQTIKNN